MITRLFAWLGSLALTRPRLVLTLYAICLLAALPWLLQLNLEADVRDTLPPDMARALERHNAHVQGGVVRGSEFCPGTPP